MSTVLEIFPLTVGTLIALFMAWRKLREDYPESDIFSLCAFIIFGSLAGFIIAGAIPIIDLRFWLSVVLGSLLVYLWSKRLEMRFFEIVEAITPAFLVYLVFVFVSLIPKFLGRFSLFVLTEPLLVLGCLGIFYYFSLNYRTFLWYPSGKIGIASLVALAFYFLIRAFVAWFAPYALLFSDPILDIILGIIIGVVTTLVIYFRSGRNLKYDLKGISGIIKR